MKYLVRKDKKIRYSYLRKEKELGIMRSLVKNEYLPEELRALVYSDLMKEGGVGVKLKNRCIITGRQRGVLRDFKISRMCFKELASKGFLPGIKKSSW